MSCRYVLHQNFDYEYTAPARRLRQRLMVVPPPVHGDQRRVRHRVTVEGTGARAVTGRDGFGNHVVEIDVAHVERSIGFANWVEVERSRDVVAPVLPGAALRDPRYLGQSRFTRPGPAMVDAARELRSSARGPLDLAERITSWTHGALRYAHDVTGVRTTAAQALDIGAGVCQDYAHVMLAVSRACGLAARYVSGHLVGEGGSHAWVEVLVDDALHFGLATAVAFDPTHDRRAASSYLTVAVGRDYSDVAPTSGTFRSPGAGRLTCRKRLELLEDRSDEAPTLALVD